MDKQFVLKKQKKLIVVDMWLIPLDWVTNEHLDVNRWITRYAWYPNDG